MLSAAVVIVVVGLELRARVFGYLVCLYVYYFFGSFVARKGVASCGILISKNYFIHIGVSIITG